MFGLIYNRMRWDSASGTQTNPVIRLGLREWAACVSVSS